MHDRFHAASLPAPPAAVNRAPPTPVSRLALRPRRATIARSMAPDASAQIHHLAGWRRVLLLPLALLVRAWTASLHFTYAGPARRHLEKIDEPVAFILWHNRLFLVAEIFRRHRQGRPLQALVSASKDGAWLTAFFSLMGIRAARGSSSRLGREAASALIEALRSGDDVGITPDGPKGPCYDFKPGGLIVTRRARAPILLLGAAFERAWQLRSWDRFYIPAPFSRVHLYCELVPPAEVARLSAPADTLRHRLLRLSPDRPPSAFSPV